ncbi:uncharacterized protein Z520_04390 [Fonsecaea multimorphosa CBS 102226]|uniref:Heterokaryon incompatibility domain-containing protein n=1 Tax=Fonsecaea multimorphosa CBS 102226 TaxID=1442371 RepID=A0A0D2K975_9EURO|nr:uncharacterized protein Z520_04390 [Fonsecaea multimorphosa CBS 102226]KIX99754.1 hypothetical protein Z520_04390 [Fonsecaea multimorphosa CBS 102226]
MNHIPLPPAPALAHIEIPVYGNNSNPYRYTQPWLSYPARHGFGFLAKQDSDELHQCSEALRSNLAAFVLSWLFFGVLEEFLGVKQDHAEWIVTTEKGHQVISTSHLCERLDAWRTRIKQLDGKQQLEIRAGIDLVLDHMDSMHNTLSQTTADIIQAVQSGSGPYHSDLLPDELNLSLEVLHNTLSLARNVVLQAAPLSFSTYSKSRLVHDQLAKNGWCPSEVSRLEQECSVVSSYFSSRLSVLGLSAIHSKCSHWQCEAWQVDQSNYRTKHVNTLCDCTFIGLPTERIAEIIRGSQIPCLRLDRRGNRLELVAIDQSAPIRFTAISHVWADGLGNHAANALPLCQVRLIQERVNMIANQGSKPLAASDNQPFWMDTLCIPVGEGFEAERNTAIAEMRTIYRISGTVLVLNNELNNISVDRSPWELAARITRTAWFRRLWTLHEGVLAKKTVFQLQDGSVDLSELQIIVQGWDDSSKFEDLLCRLIFVEACQPYSKLLAFKSKSLPSRVRDIWTAVQWRNTSYQEDETICLANMLGLDLSSILAVSRYDSEAKIKRMKAFILAQKYFPRGSIFQGDYSSLTRPSTTELIGFEWAPQSFVFRTRAALEQQPDTHLALADELGFHVSLVALIPDKGWDVFTQAGKNSTELGDLYRAFFMVPWEWDYFYFVNWDMGRGRWDLVNSLREKTFPALILQQDITLVTDETLDQDGSAGHDRDGSSMTRMFDDDLIAEEAREEVLREMMMEARGETVDEDYAPYQRRIFSASTSAILVAASVMDPSHDHSNMTDSLQHEHPSAKSSNPNVAVEYQARIIQHVQVEKEMFNTYTQAADAQLQRIDGAKYRISSCEKWSSGVRWCIQ